MSKHPAGALSFLSSGEAAPSRAAAFDVLDAQQREVHQAFRQGFDDPRQLLEWTHAAGAVSLGYVDNDWYPRVFGDWWTVAGFLNSEQRRQDLAEPPPANPMAHRERHLQRELLPAFRSAIGLLRTKATEWDEHQQPSQSNAQRFLAMRPRLHQVAVGQHRALRRALGAGTADSLQSRQDVTDWARTVVQVTTGAVPRQWIDRVTRPGGVWFALLTGDSGRSLLLTRLARDLLPAFNQALQDAAQRGVEQVESDAGVDQSPLSQ